MTNTSKMTYVMALDVVLNGGEITAEVREKLEALKASHQRKNSGERKPSAKQVANAERRIVLLGEMEEGRAYTITQMTKELPCVLGESVSKVSYLVRSLKDEGLVHREVIKGTAYFTKSEEV